VSGSVRVVSTNTTIDNGEMVISVVVVLIFLEDLGYRMKKIEIKMSLFFVSIKW